MRHSREIRYDQSMMRTSLVLLVAFLFRMIALGIKPPHFDEGINGHFVLQIWRDGFYSYDPTNFHGPLYFYLLHFAEILWGRSVESFRIMNALIAVGLVGAVWSLRREVGRVAEWAAWILAVSPAFVFYGRYAIHESLFVLGQVLFVAGRFRRRSFLTALGAVIMIATKETFFIFIGTWFIAEFLIGWLERWELGGARVAEPRESRWVVVAAVVLSVTSLLLLFTGFLAKPSGAFDFFKAFDFWSKTGQVGNGHEKEWSYWLMLLARYEWPLLLSLSLVPLVLWRSSSRRVRTLVLAGFGHWLAYTLIPYKTPWLILGFWPLAFVMGGLIESTSGWVRRVVKPIAISLLAISTWKAYELSFEKFVDPTEPYVYVQTTADYTNVMAVLKRAVQARPELRNELVLLLVKEPWPLPYDMSLFPHLKYVRLEDLAADPSLLERAGLLLIDEDPWNGVRKILKKPMLRMSFHLRDAYQGGWALFDQEKFKSFVPLGAEVEGAR